MLPTITSTQSHLIIITCFWAKSKSLDTLISALQSLSLKASQRSNGEKIKVFIGLSSLSLQQKLFQTSAPEGHTYTPGEYGKKLWLPHPSELPGLDMTVKSIFNLPFSVMHPKFVVSDGKLVWLPSCNVSWENWFEGAVLLSGKDIVQNFVTFWEEFWLCRDVDEDKLQAVGLDADDGYIPTHPEVSGNDVKPVALARMDFDRLIDVEETETECGMTLETVFLPSAHHRNPKLFPLPWLAPPPPTPLNTFLLTMLSTAKSRIFLQSPNITCPPVLRSLRTALQRGVNVHLRTSSDLMVLEQLVTALTTTSRSMSQLITWYKRQKAMLEDARQHDPEGNAGRQKLARLKVEYFVPRRGEEEGSGSDGPVQSHVKLSVFDGDVVVLGSGNMDRASWYTSQELGVAFKNSEMVSKVVAMVESAMQGRTNCIYDSDDGKAV
jgi:phosphatidylserine/phosphatidylglycerophosphate/cardiolipin synthase-like enzyme